MSTLGEALVEYLELRRGLGFKMQAAGLQLPRFVGFLERQQTSFITTRLALEWSQEPASVQPAEWARRLGYVRGFARYRSATDPRTEIPTSGLLPHHSTRARPYLYSDAELQALLDAALAWPTRWPSTPLRPQMLHCLFGLLAVTGMRFGEALDLQLDDIDLGTGLLTLRSPKLGRSRLVPIHATTSETLAAYLKHRLAAFGRDPSPYVFVSSRGNRVDMAQLHRNFYELSRRVGLRAAGASHGPRLHDLRHRFAVRTLQRWYEQGVDVQRKLPVLSTYLGHVNVEDTYWYLNAWPELMAHATARLERRWETTP